jgi:hypothetical protein
MDLASILAKIAGLVLLVITARSAYKHFKEKRVQKKDDQAQSEKFLNNLIYYVWIFFMTAFSIGMIANN